MRLSGSAAIAHPVGDVFAALVDPAVLVRTLPGCQSLAQTGPDSYQATMAAGVGSIKGLFDGDVRLSDLSAPDSFTLHASGAGTPGTVDAVAHVRLVADPASGGTLVHYAADATVGGVLGGVGQRMIAGVARRTAGEFFAAVDRELSAARLAVAPGPAAAATTVPVAPVAAAVRELPSLRAASPAREQPPAAPADEPARVWTRPPAVREPERQRVRELILAATLGAAIALLGVIIGAIVASS
jgi:carbon monoxide dehydrogenase subunit G